MPLFGELKRRNVIRVAVAYLAAAWLITEVAGTVLPAFGYGDAQLRVLIILLVIATVPVLVFSWVFEITPEGLKREVHVDQEQSITRFTGKKIDRIIIVLLALGLVYFAFDKFVVDPVEDVQIAESAHQEGRTEAITDSYGDKSIAVLPFVNMSSDPEQEYFSDGISEELLNLLSKIPDLRVISRSSAFSFKGKDIAIPVIAEQLNVAHVLEGSVRKDGDRVRITAQLIEAGSDTHLWSGAYERTLDDIFAIQNEIAAMVVRELKLTLLGGIPKAKPVDPEAYTLYLHARYLRTRNTPEGLEQAIVLYKQVLAIAPDYAKAWRSLAVVYRAQIRLGLLPREDGEALSRETLNRALAINPDLPEAHADLGWGAIGNRDFLMAAEHLEYALSLEPTNVAAIISSYVLLGRLGRTEKSIILREYLLSRAPLEPIFNWNLAVAYLRARRPDDAIVSFRTVLMLSPNYIGARACYGMAMLQKGKTKSALNTIREEPSEPWRLIGLAMAYHARGQLTDSDMALHELIGKYESTRAYWIAAILAYRGEADRTFLWLDKAEQYNDSELSNIVIEPWFANIHEDPRWLPFLEGIGMSPAQLDAIEFEVTPPK